MTSTLSTCCSVMAAYLSAAPDECLLERGERPLGPPPSPSEQPPPWLFTAASCTPKTGGRSGLCTTRRPAW